MGTYILGLIWFDLIEEKVNNGEDEDDERIVWGFVVGSVHSGCVWLQLQYRGTAQRS